LSPFAEITLSPVQSIRKARKQKRKKHETRHLTSENIENASEEMRLKVGRERTQKEKETIRRAVAGFLTGTFQF
jgi:membrane-bound lytic murein transglycosylase B